jgi:hypothetical protein
VTGHPAAAGSGTLDCAFVVCVAEVEKGDQLILIALFNECCTRPIVRFSHPADQLEGSRSEDGAVDDHGVVFVAGAAGLRLEIKERGCVCIYTRGINVGGEVLAMAEISGRALCDARSRAARSCSSTRAGPIG